jgi:hypothetical protein
MQHTFDRQASSPNGVFMEDKSPIPSEVWSLEPRVDGKNVVWWVKELGKSFTSSELASQVAIRLVKQYEAYEHIRLDDNFGVGVPLPIF